jgi:hypothetical protein
MNLLTHFRKITILRFVLAGPVLLFSVPALFGDGIASRYPNDVGIENDPNVLLADGFESYTSPSQLLNKWDHAVRQTNLRIATEPGNYVGGHKSLEMTLPISSTEVGNSITKFIIPKEPVLHIRAYAKFDPGFSLQGGSHNGLRLRGGNSLAPGVPAPRDGSGFFTFVLQNHRLGTGRGGENLPGFAKVYSYWPFQRTNYGDHWCSDGWVIPGGWGLWVLYPFQYPDFKPLPNWQPIRGVWYCYEFMVQVNALGTRNGVVAYWINGQLKGRWPNLFIRSIDSLKIDFASLDLHATKSARVNKKWYDNVVIARSYIGPISPAGPTPTPTPTVTPTATPTPTPTPTAPPPPPPKSDFNRDGKPDYLLYNAGTRQTAVWYLNNNAFIGGSFGPTLPVGWRVIDAADFNRDGRPDYALFNASTRQTAIWYLSGVNGVTIIGGANGPTLPSGWALVATGEFNNDLKPDYVIYNASTRQTAIWYLNNNVFIGGVFGPTIPAGWSLVGIADFNRDGKRDYLLFNPNTHASVIWYLSGTTRIGSAYGPTIAAGYNLTGAADFNRDGKPDYLLFNPSTRGTAIWYLNNNVRISAAFGPTLAAGYILAAP